MPVSLEKREDHRLQYKSIMHNTLIKNGVKSYGDLELDKVPTRKISKSVLSFLYKRCIQSLQKECEDYIEEQSVNDLASDYFGWSLMILPTDIGLEARAFNLDVTLKYEIQTIEDLKSFMEVLSSLQYEVA